MVNNRSKKILVVGPAWVGDMVMTQSLFKVIKQQDPQATIDVLAPSWSRDILERMPEVRRSWISPFAHQELSLKKRMELGEQLRTEQYDQAIMIPNTIKSVVAPFWARIPQRTGWHGEWPRRWLLLNDSRKLDKKRWPLMAERFAALGLPADVSPQPLLWPHLVISPQTRQAALQKYGLSQSSRPLLVLAPGAEFGVSKRWPPEYFAQVAMTQAAAGWDVWLMGSPRDQAISAAVAAQAPQVCRDLTGRTNLAEAIDLLSLASIVVGNDSGLMHISAALQRKVVAIYGPTPPDLAPPLTQHYQSLSLHLACSPCFRRECPLQHNRCMRDLKPERVLNSIAQLMDSHD